MRGIFYTGFRFFIFLTACSTSWLYYFFSPCTLYEGRECSQFVLLSIGQGEGTYSIMHSEHVAWCNGTLSFPRKDQGRQDWTIKEELGNRKNGCWAWAVCLLVKDFSCHAKILIVGVTKKDRVERNRGPRNVYLYDSVSKASVSHECCVWSSFQGEVPQGDVYFLSRPSLYHPRAPRRAAPGVTLLRHHARYVTGLWRQFGVTVHLAHLAGSTLHCKVKQIMLWLND